MSRVRPSDQDAADFEVLRAFLGGQAAAASGRVFSIANDTLLCSGYPAGRRYVTGHGEDREVLLWFDGRVPTVSDWLSAEPARRVQDGVSVVYGLRAPHDVKEALEWRRLLRIVAAQSMRLRELGWRRLHELPEASGTASAPRAGQSQRNRIGQRLTRRGPRAGPLMPYIPSEAILPIPGLFERHPTDYRHGLETHPVPFVMSETWVAPHGGPILMAARALADAQHLPIAYALEMVALGLAK